MGDMILWLSGWWFGTWLLFSISYLGCHPSHWRTPSFFKMLIAPPDLWEKHGLKHEVEHCTNSSNCGHDPTQTACLCWGRFEKLKVLRTLKCSCHGCVMLDVLYQAGAEQIFWGTHKEWLWKLNNWLVVWNMNFMIFHSVVNVIIPTDELIFFRGVGIPPTR